MAKTTARPSGVNRYFAGPSRKTTEVKTQRMAMVETSVGMAIPAAPYRVAKRQGLSLLGQQAMGVFDGDGGSSTNMPTARARPPSVMVLRVWPKT